MSKRFAHSELTPTFVDVDRRLVSHHAVSPGGRRVPEETPVALTYGRSTYAVMMATPADLEDFAIGFSLTERIIDDPAEVAALEIVSLPQGIEARMSLSSNRDEQLLSRRRRIFGPAGCGLCGIESLEAAVAPPATVTSPVRVSVEAIFRALKELRSAQSLNEQTRATHAAGFWANDHLVAVREDVGRHNALDKVAGALARMKVDGASGMLLLSSRLSIELVQKAAAIDCPIVVAVSAPTAFALRAAEACGMTAVAVARDDSVEVFTHPHRIEVAQSQVR